MILRIKKPFKKGETYIAKPIPVKRYKMKAGQLLTNTYKNASMNTA